MANSIERNLGDQPVLSIMADLGLVGHDLVAASSDQITHKMVGGGEYRISNIELRNVECRSGGERESRASESIKPIALF